ncbi:hypothetical protein HK097_002476 [Rhizophlyctis rosea]|uniref:Biogenesis of lysosome-related organelles complex 1 subunit 1 n=1 Tax=Rhizophlyctis rosea TaxID=64517 RepID=A0AAD5S3I3_9FUNG|nr:hypothetical protein HK097_002476 [Rhizophlyctis rosea]
MLANVLKERARTTNYSAETLRRDATVSASAITDTLADILNADVATAFKNQKDIETEAKRLQLTTIKFTKQTQDWLTLADDFSSALKELGDLQSWSGAIENDIEDICLTLEKRLNLCATSQKDPTVFYMAINKEIHVYKLPKRGQQSVEPIRKLQYPADSETDNSGPTDGHPDGPINAIRCGWLGSEEVLASVDDLGRIFVWNWAVRCIPRDSVKRIPASTNIHCAFKQQTSWFLRGPGWNRIPHPLRNLPYPTLPRMNDVDQSAPISEHEDGPESSIVPTLFDDSEDEEWLEASEGSRISESAEAQGVSGTVIIDEAFSDADRLERANLAYVHALLQRARQSLATSASGNSAIANIHASGAGHNDDTNSDDANTNMAVAGSVAAISDFDGDEPMTSNVGTTFHHEDDMEDGEPVPGVDYPIDDSELEDGDEVSVEYYSATSGDDEQQVNDLVAEVFNSDSESDDADYVPEEQDDEAQWSDMGSAEEEAMNEVVPPPPGPRSRRGSFQGHVNASGQGWSWVVTGEDGGCRGPEDWIVSSTVEDVSLSCAPRLEEVCRMRGVVESIGGPVQSRFLRVLMMEDGGRLVIARNAGLCFIEYIEELSTLVVASQNGPAAIIRVVR